MISTLSKEKLVKEKHYNTHNPQVQSVVHHNLEIHVAYDRIKI